MLLSKRLNIPSAWANTTNVTNLGWYGQFHTKSSVWLHGQLLLLKLLVRSLPATLYTFYAILNMLSEWFKPTRSGSMVLSGHGKWLCSYIFSNPPKVHGRVPWANPFTISHFLCVPHYYWGVGRPEWVSGSIPTTAHCSPTGWQFCLYVGYRNTPV